MAFEIIKCNKCHLHLSTFDGRDMSNVTYYLCKICNKFGCAHCGSGKRYFENSNAESTIMNIISKDPELSKLDVLDRQQIVLIFKSIDGSHTCANCIVLFINDIKIYFESRKDKHLKYKKLIKFLEEKYSNDLRTEILNNLQKP